MSDQIHIQLDLRHHCIESDIKALYNRKVGQYFKTEQNRGRLEVEIELLKTVLETFDFGRLRSAYPELAGKSDCSVAICLAKPNDLVIMIDDNPIVPLWR